MKPESPPLSIAEAHKISVELLITDATLALNLLDLAETTEIAKDRTRRIAEAHRAHDSILSLLPRLKPTRRQMEVLSGSLQRLEARLKAADASRRR